MDSVPGRSKTVKTILPMSMLILLRGICVPIG